MQNVCCYIVCVLRKKEKSNSVLFNVFIRLDLFLER